MNNIIEITLEKLYKENPTFGFKDMFTCKKLYPNKLFSLGNEVIYEIKYAKAILMCFNFSD